jgi:hypothetical protein
VLLDWRPLKSDISFLKHFFNARAPIHFFLILI